MKYEIVDFPVKHIVVHDFLSKEDLSMCMEEIEKLKDHLWEGTWWNRERGAHVDHSIKKCLNLDLYQHWGDDRRNSFMLREVINKKMWTDEMRKIYDKTGSDSMFSNMNETTRDYCMLAGFRDGDFYKWHKDMGITTCNIMISDNKAEFEGGDFFLSNRISGSAYARVLGDKFQTIKYAYKPGTAIFFPARFDHMVSKVKVKSGNIKDMRFTLQSRCFVMGG